MTKTRRQASDAMLSAGSLLALITGMSILNADVRVQVANIMAGDSNGQLSAMAFRAQSYGHELMKSAAQYRADNGPMVGFGLVAVVLAFLMFKT